MHFSTSVLLSVSFAFATSVLADVDSQTAQLGLRTKPIGKVSKRAVASLLDTRDTCKGTCQTCFGPTFTDCPGSTFYCYDPAQGPASAQCSGGSGASAQSSAPTPVPSGGATDTCFQKGATCKTCFGAGSTNCPSGSYYDCYEPAKVSQDVGCNKPGSAGGSGGSGVSSAPAAATPTGSGNQCADQYGAGSVLCGANSCYNPGQGEVCCGDGCKLNPSSFKPINH
jgi:hypothetical protein